MLLPRARHTFIGISPLNILRFSPLNILRFRRPAEDDDDDDDDEDEDDDDDYDDDSRDWFSRGSVFVISGVFFKFFSKCFFKSFEKSCENNIFEKKVLRKCFE